MSEAPWGSRARVAPLMRPEVVIGAASPLWGFFTGAAVAGMGWWWMNRWLQRPDVQPVAGIAAPRAAKLLVEAVAGPVVEALAAEEPPAEPVGGEPAPVAAAALAAEAIPEPQLASEPTPAPAALEAQATPAPTPASRSRKPREGEPKPH